MKNKIVSFILALSLIFSLAVTVSADSQAELPPVSLSPVGLTITSGSITGGGTQTVSVNITENSGVNVIQFSVKYDQDVLEVVNAVQGAVISNDASCNAVINTSTDAADGLIDFALDSTEELNTGGSILDITFKSKSKKATTESTDIMFYTDTDIELVLGRLESGSINPTYFEVSCTNGKLVFSDYSTGYTISGTVASWNNSDDIVYLLYPASMTDIDIRKDAKLDSPTKNITTGVTTEKLEVTSNGKSGTQSYEQEFTMTVDTGGSYKVAIRKKNGYAIPVIEAEATDDVNLGDIALYLLGDFDNNGKTVPADRMSFARYLAHWKNYSLTVPDYVMDIDINGKVAALDRLCLARYLAHWKEYQSYFS